MRLVGRKAQGLEDVLVVVQPGSVGRVQRLLRHGVTPRPGAYGQFYACGTRRSAATKGQRDDVTQLLTRVVVGIRQTSRELFGGAFAPGLQHPAQQVFTVAKVPVETAARDLKLLGQFIHTHMVYALVHQHAGRGFDPGFGGQRCAGGQLGLGAAGAVFAWQWTNGCGGHGPG